MVEALYCVLTNARRHVVQTVTQDQFTEMLLKLRKWQLEMSSIKDVSHKSFKRWLKITVPPGPCIRWSEC
jgi:hypothetical protein